VNATSPSSKPEGLRPSDVLLLAAALLALYVPGTIGVSLFDRDEGWYACITRSMVESGDWIVPRYLGESRYWKPPLLYWCSALSTRLLGWSEFALRLPCVLASVSTWVFVATATARRYGRRAGYWSAIIGATALGSNIAGKLLLADAYLLLFSTIALIVWLDRIGRSPRTATGGYLFWASLGMAILAKGPAVLVVLVPVGLTLLITESPRGVGLVDRLGRVWPGPGWYVAIGIALPWHLAAAWADWPSFRADYLDVHFAQRLSEPMEGHSGPPGYYLLTSAAFLWPWAGLVPSVLAAAWTARRVDPHCRRLLIWLIAPWPLFELIETKLPHYVLPLFPPLAILAARELSRVSGSAPDRLRMNGLANVLWIGGLAVGALSLAAGVVIWRDHAVALGLGVAGAVLLGGTMHAARGRIHVDWHIRCKRAAIAVGLCYALVGCWVLPGLEPDRLSRRIANIANALIEGTNAEKPDVLAYGYEEPTMFYYLSADARRLRPSEPEWRDWTGRPFVLIARTDRLADLRHLCTMDESAGQEVSGFNYVRGRSETVWIGWCSPIRASGKRLGE